MRKKTLIALLLLAFAGLVPGGLSSAAGEQHVIRVGCVDIDQFLVSYSNDDVVGYGADYLEEIAQRTGWKYEFIQGSWTDCLNMLETGELDLLLPAEYSEERAERFLFSEQMCCMDYVALLGREEDSSLYYNDFENFNGIKVGVIDDNYLNEVFDQFAARHDFSVQYIKYPSGTLLDAALERGEVDAIIDGNMSYLPGQKVLTKIAAMPAYFITGKENAALMEALNAAQQAILIDDPYYAANLHQKYYGESNRQFIGFTREEAEYAASLSEITLFVRPNNYPLEFIDEKTGEAAGILIDAAKKALNESGLSYQVLPWPGTDNFAALARQDGVQMTVCSELVRKSKDDSIISTDTLIPMNYDIICKSGQSVSDRLPLRIAFSERIEGGGKQRLIEQKYPNWTLVRCSSADECLSALKSGMVDLALISSVQWEARSNEWMRGGLVAANAGAISVNICLGVETGADPMLLSILNKGVQHLSTDDLNQCIYHYIVSDRAITISELIRSYPLEFAFSLFAICLAVMIGISLAIRTRLTKRQNLLLSAKNKELEEAIEVQHALRIEAEQDPLTGLKNRRALQDICKCYTEAHVNEPTAMLVLDIDDFKLINDTYGHQAGDEALCRLADCLRSVFNECPIGRIGGDEFMVMTSFPNGEKQAEQILNQFLDELARPIFPFAIRASVGVAMRRNSSENCQSLYRRADQALYRVKGENGKQYMITWETGEGKREKRGAAAKKTADKARHDRKEEQTSLKT